MNSFLLLCDVFSFLFWKKLKSTKIHFEIIWPLAVQDYCARRKGNFKYILRSKLDSVRNGNILFRIKYVNWYANLLSLIQLDYGMSERHLKLHKMHDTLDYTVNHAGLLSLGVPGGTMPWHPQILADQFTLYQPRGADYAHQIILAPPDFQTFRRPCLCR